MLIINIQPVIKWTGSKRYLAQDILSHFPKEINTYYEPCVGGGSIIRQLLESDIKVEKYVCSDINQYLIELWNLIKNNPNKLIKTYTTMWNEMNEEDDIQFRKSYYLKVRNNFNKLHNATDFLFLSRTCTNGLIRFNSKGEFNTSYHLTRKGIEPKKLAKIIKDWSDCLNKNNVEFICCDYRDIQPKENDFMYLDPPYTNTDSMYFGELKLEEFFTYLKELQCNYILSFNGKRTNKDTTYDIPKDLYSKHIYMQSGNSGFKKLQQQIDKVQESLYIKINKSCE